MRELLARVTTRSRRSDRALRVPHRPRARLARGRARRAGRPRLHGRHRRKPGADPRARLPGRGAGSGSSSTRQPNAPRRPRISRRGQPRLHLRARADRLQGRHRDRDRRRPDPEAARHPFSARTRSSRMCCRSSRHVPHASLLTLLVAIVTVAVSRSSWSDSRRRAARAADRGRRRRSPRRDAARPRRRAASSIVGKVPTGLPSLTLPDLSLLDDVVGSRAGDCPDELHRDGRRRAGVHG